MKRNATTVSERRGHVRVSVSLLESEVSDAAHRLWCHLDNLAREAEHVTMTVAEVADVVRKSVRSVRRYTEELVRAGYVKVRGQRGAGGATTYTLLARSRPVRRGVTAVVERVVRWVPRPNVTAPPQAHQGECARPVTRAAVPFKDRVREKNTHARGGRAPVAPPVAGVTIPDAFRRQVAAARPAPRSAARVPA